MDKSYLMVNTVCAVRVQIANVREGMNAVLSHLFHKKVSSMMTPRSHQCDSYAYDTVNTISRPSVMFQRSVG